MAVSAPASTAGMPQRGVRYARAALVTLWAGLLGSALADRFVDAPRLSAWTTELKAASSLMLVLYAWLVSWTTQGHIHSVARWIACGMTLGAMGDASPLLGDLWPEPQRTLTNMVLFGIGHLAYIGACAQIRQASSTPRKMLAWKGAILAWWILGILCWYFAAWSGHRFPIMRLPALAYTMLLATTTGVTAGFALEDRRYVSVACGALLFLVSDVVLALGIFHAWSYRPIDLVWSSYGVGQMLIVVGTVRYLEQSSAR